MESAVQPLKGGPAARVAAAGNAGVEMSAIPKAAVGTRIGSIDALRGLVMLFMLLDHIRETFILWMPVTDPVDANSIDPGLFFTRLTSTFCAPTFVALTGLSAYLYSQKHTKKEVSWFLFSRGLFLVFLEVTVIAYCWATQPLYFPPPTIFLQVIWAIGLSMIALAGLIHLPRVAQLVIGIGIVCIHNLLDPIVLTPESPYFEIWGVLHQRIFIPLGDISQFKTSYPVLPWIGLILLGYVVGPLFGKLTTSEDRIRRLMILGVGLLVGFVVIRALNFYGDLPWYQADTQLRTVMSFLALTKYPPSLLFLMPTVGVGCLLLAWFERLKDNAVLPHLALFGGAPMFFYIVHLYLLKLLYNIGYAIYGPNHGELFGFDTLGAVWLLFALLIVPLYFPTRWFAQLKQRRRDIWWLKYL